MRKMIALPIALVAACAIASPAFAKHARKRAAQTETAATAQARVCQPLCQTDMSPCDPPEFKHADGRCDFGAYGGGGGGGFR